MPCPVGQQGAPRASCNHSTKGRDCTTASGRSSTFGCRPPNVVGAPPQARRGRNGKCYVRFESGHIDLAECTRRRP
eukprot:4643588-Pyramimonas_sp.AAC.1